MSGNSIGVLFKVTTWGESHGPALGVVIDGCPPGIDLKESDIQMVLNRRRPGRLPSSTSRKEQDIVSILSGVFEGKTTATPISLLIENKDVDSTVYDDLKYVFRPGHGDYTYHKKYGIRDYRGGGRASGRETVARVAAGAVAEKVLSREGIEVIAYTKALGGFTARLESGTIKKLTRDEINSSPLMCPDPEAAGKMETSLNEAKRRGDSLGGIVEIFVRGCPPGLGEPVFDKIDADIAKALMSIGTVKGVEIGAGFKVADMVGSQTNDPMTPEGFVTNHAGGILAGITTGEEIIVRVACKPIPSLSLPQQTITVEGKPVEISIRGRHDVSVIPRIVPVCEAMVSIILVDHLLRQKAVRG